MKIRIECQEDIKEDEILIRTNHLDEEIQQLTKSISALLSQNKNITFYKGDTVYYLSLQDILFFETESGEIYALLRKKYIALNINYMN